MIVKQKKKKIKRTKNGPQNTTLETSDMTS